MGYPGEDRWVHRSFDVGEVTLHAVECGEGPLVVLLHGFPDFWWGWRWQLGTLAAAGFRVVAPDLRGYGGSEKPAGVWNYRLDALANDVAGLIKACGAERAAVVGHDWGGVVAWHLALRQPRLVERLAVLNAPAPAGYRAHDMPLEQLWMGWHVLALQLPVVPEALLGFAGGALLRRLLAADVYRPGGLSPAELDRYAEAWAEPGALSAAIDYYRALPWYGLADAVRPDQAFERPTLVIWGERDPHLASALADLNPARVPAGRVERLPMAGHFVQVDARERVSELLTTFLHDRR